MRRSRCLNAPEVNEAGKDDDEAGEDDDDAEPSYKADEYEEPMNQHDKTLDDELNTKVSSPGGNAATDIQKMKNKGKKKDADTVEDKDTPSQPRLSDYELLKIANIKENRRIWGVLMEGSSASIFGEKEKVKKPRAPKSKCKVEPSERRTRSVRG